MKSAFGKGFVYNLFLFAKHFERDIYVAEGSKKDYGLWFNAAADHLSELVIPKQLKGSALYDLINWIKETGQKYHRGYFVTEEEFDEFFEKCEELCRLIDTALDIKPIKADWN